MCGLQEEELYAAFDGFRQYVKDQCEAIRRYTEIQMQEMKKAAQCLHDAWLAIRRLFLEALNSAREMFAAFFELSQKLEEHQERQEQIRRNWPRPRNQKLRPLLFDRRSRVFRCRNAI